VSANFGNLSTAASKPLHAWKVLVICSAMDHRRIDEALTRIDAALARISAARAAAGGAPEAPARVVELINTHEKLREEVTETLRDLDALIEQMEG
jgi:ribosomal protein L12E/L44/L45/RPP1/RPP2